MQAIEIRIARIRAGLTQQQLAKQMFCDRATISRIETGKIDVSEERLQAIAEITGVDLFSGR